MVFDNSKKNELIASCDMEAELDERQLCDVELLMQGGETQTEYKSFVVSFSFCLYRLFPFGWLHG